MSIKEKFDNASIYACDNGAEFAALLSRKKKEGKGFRGFAISVIGKVMEGDQLFALYIRNGRAVFEFFRGTETVQGISVLKLERERGVVLAGREKAFLFTDKIDPSIYYNGILERCRVTIDSPESDQADVSNALTIRQKVRYCMSGAEHYFNLFM